METILNLKNISKKYKNQQVLNNLTLKINKGDIYALVGKNGAGKTTIMKIITTLIKDYNGSVSIFNSSNKKEQTRSLSRVSSIIEQPDTYGNLSAYNNLKYYCKIRGISNYDTIEETLSFVGLQDVGKKKVKHFSLGMKQRLGLAIALLSNPDLLILDEPINGLDPIGIMEFRDLLLRINEEFNTTILISSHILGELYHVATRFGFIDQGTMVKEIDKETLDAESEERIVIESNNLPEVSIALKELGINFKSKNQKIEIFDNISTQELNKVFFEKNIEIRSIFRSKIDLENYFKELIGGKM